MILLAGALILVAGYIGSRRLVVREVEARVRGLPASFDGLRIAQISDLARRSADVEAIPLARRRDGRARCTRHHRRHRRRRRRSSRGRAVVRRRFRPAPRAAWRLSSFPAITTSTRDGTPLSRSLASSTDATILVNDSRLVERAGASARHRRYGRSRPRAPPRHVA